MIESLLIAGACMCAVFAGFYVHLRWSMRFIHDQMSILDEKLAHALKSTLEQLPLGDIEPVNPIQMMIMQLIQDNMAKNPAKVLPRDDAGLFVANTESESESD